MKKKEKELTKKARKQIRLSLEELLTDEIKKAIIGQGRNPKKAAKEIKKSVSLIAKTLAKKESLSLPAAEKSTSKTPQVRESVKSFDVPPIPAPELPVVPDPPLPKTTRVRKAASPAAVKAEVSATSPVRRGRRTASQPTAEAEAVPSPPARKRAPRKPAVKVEATSTDAISSNPEEGSNPPPSEQENLD